jgi:excisionase family DNA binding protein
LTAPGGPPYPPLIRARSAEIRPDSPAPTTNGSGRAPTEGAITRTSTRGVQRSGEWLSLGPAAKRLGVDADTLRRWADAGRIEAFTTPGGHRRFSRRAIDRIIATGTPGDASVGEGGATSARLTAAYRRTTIRRRRARDLPMGPEDREVFQAEGRELVEALVRYLDASTPEERATIETDATALARDLGGRLGASRVPAPAAVARFVDARRPLLTELGRVAARRHLDAERTAGVLGEASAVLDRLMLAFITAHSDATPERDQREG